MTIDILVLVSCSTHVSPGGTAKPSENCYGTAEEDLVSTCRLDTPTCTAPIMCMIHLEVVDCAVVVAAVAKSAEPAFFTASNHKALTQTLHGLLHARTGRCCDLVVVNLVVTARHLVEALVDDPEGLSELLCAAEIPVVAVAAVRRPSSSA